MLLEHHLVAQRVHRMPEAFVPVGRELPFSRKAFHRFALPDSRVAFDVVEDVGLDDEEAAVDPPPPSPRGVV
jgi:hypothetical protein